MAFGSSASTCETAPGAAADDELPEDELPDDAAGVLLEPLELLEHPAATSVVTAAAASVPAAILPGRRRAAGAVAVCVMRWFIT